MFFANHPVSKDILKKAYINQRTIFELANPLLSEQTKKISKNNSLWLN